ncbi:MAG: cobaltochelatase subunit CobN [Cetobacterium sp.]|uniref:cobaltochelatase subunit CobN n=1 Tax=Cetobacterium sp. TaxID=2071632 RepID=UPI002FCAE59F
MFKITFITSSEDVNYSFNKVCREIEKKYEGDFEFQFFRCSLVDKDEIEYKKLEEQIRTSSIVYILLHGGVSSFKNLSKLKNIYGKKIPFFINTTIEDENREFVEKSGLSTTLIYTMSKYFKLGGEKNYKNLVLYTASNLSSKKYPFEEYEYIKWEGIYNEGKFIENEKEFIEKISKEEKVIAILFHGKEWNYRQIKVVNKFVEEIKKMGAIPYPIFTNSIARSEIKSKGIKWVIENYLKYEGKVIPKVIINLMSYSQTIFSNPGDGSTIVEKSIFENLDIPVIQALSTYQNRETWEKDIRGLDTESLTIGVYYPEFDGQIISVTCCTHENIKDEYGERKQFIPIDERVNKITRMAFNWMSLRIKKNEDKKIAVILHNMPPRNDMIGRAFGLDTPNSVNNMMKFFSEIGIKLAYEFKDGNEIINNIIKGVSNDKKWLTSEKVLEKSIDRISKDKYCSWFKKLDQDVQMKMEKQWGDPPGKFMVYDDILPVPGIINGNVFIGLQPSRGMEEKSEEIYHSTDFIIPHQYYSFYKWIKEEFKADVIYHVGTHGTLEWLPGKEVGLSSDCCPDFNIDDIPHLYPYSVNISGEGLQAKRRSNAVLISYMIPSLTLAGEYEDIEKLDDLVKQYYQAKMLNNSKLYLLKEDIIKRVFEYNYNLDMEITEEEIRENYPLFINKLHSYIEELKNSVIKDGLHILGKAPENERLVSLIYALLRTENCGMMAAEECVGKSLDYDIEELKGNPFICDINGETNLMKLDTIRNITVRVIEEILNKKNYEEVVSDYKGYKIFNRKFLLNLEKNILNIVLPKILETEREKRSILNGVEGRFILPGASGYPTRGNINILPTGTNFYSIDPYKIPSRASWKMGMKLGDELIKRYIKDEGKFPENIAMILYSGDTIKTNGDDVAEALYLMGVRPVWLNNGDRVIGLEVIPYEELGRPRIDVTLRISGLFRDTFPILITLLEKAVNIVSQLDESEEINYIRKNLKIGIKELLQEGYELAEAQKLARVRIFGCPPGTYGTGVRSLIESQQWENREDLGKAYVTWSSHAYTGDYHGKKIENIFVNRLKKIDITIKNEASIELDMLESDDYYSYHGGLTAAIKYAGGKNVQSYSGNTSDPNNVQIKSLKEEAARIMRSRILNPKWFEGLKQHGYKGAVEVSAMVDIIFGWDATAEIAEDWMYDKLSEKYIENTESREWIYENNPHALMNMTERLLEAEQRGMWKTSDEKLNELRKIYLGIEGEIEGYEE